MIQKLTLAAVIFCLAGCSVGHDYAEPQTPPNFLTGWAAQSKAVSSDEINTKWWSVFNDPLLEQYINLAVAHNKDVEIALANVRRARAIRAEQDGVFWPEVGADAGAARAKSANTSTTNNGQIRNTYDAGFDASWELDIFGGNQRASEAAEARVDASVAKYQDVMLATLSEVARTYFEARGVQKRLTITQQNAQLLKETLDVIKDRLAVGETSNFDLTRAKGEYELTVARIPNLQAELNSSVYQLSYLLGQPPESLLDDMQAVSPLPAPPDIVPVGLRSDILRRRPDIKAAERELAASSADIGAQTAELFPQFYLTGDIGTQARVFGDLFSASHGLWSLASMVQWSVFEGGALRARINIEQAEYEAALATYEKAVLAALRDTETALIRYGKELETRERLAQGVQSRRESLALAKELFDAGEEDYLAVIDAERQLIASEDDLIISETSVITKLITLYTTLGGGWDVFK